MSDGANFGCAILFELSIWWLRNLGRGGWLLVVGFWVIVVGSGKVVLMVVEVATMVMDGLALDMGDVGLM